MRFSLKELFKIYYLNEYKWYFLQTFHLLVVKSLCNGLNSKSSHTLPQIAKGKSLLLLVQMS
jgi:hypothetical protein